jgi:hypothetical protein
MAQQMTVKEGHAANDWIGEIHDQVHRAFGRHVYRVEPFRLRFWLIVCGIEQEMDLVNVKWMNLMRLVHNSPVLIRTDADTGHGRVLGSISLAVNIEACLSSVKVTVKSGEVFSSEGSVASELGTNTDFCILAGAVRVARASVFTSQVCEDHTRIGIAVGIGIKAPRP